jgi:fatty acid desaturase
MTGLVLYAQDSMAESPKNTVVVDWYRSPIPTAEFKKLHERNDWRAFGQTGGYLAIVAATGTLTWWSWAHWAWPWTVLCMFLHGTASHFHINGMHELGHGTVFKTKALNAFFVRVLSFFAWLHPDMFNASHQRHHRYTLHPPDDQEVVLPVKLTVKNFFEQGFVNVKGFWWTMKYAWRIARGKIGSEGGWEAVCFPPEQLQMREVPICWARILLGSHLVIAAVSLYFGQWMVPIIVSLAPFVGGWLFFLLNNAQHTGRVDNVPDFRLCCRTILPPAFVRFLYWQMNYHTEHHMYAAVPCYNLPRLHRAIKHDLPHCPGIIGAWREIASVLRKQEQDPSYRPEIALPVKAAQ